MTRAPTASRVAGGRRRPGLAPAVVAELVKIVRRPAIGVLLAASAAVLVYFTQVRFYLSYLDTAAAAGGVPDWVLDTTVAALQPAGAVMVVLSGTAGYGAVMAGVFGALVAGSEHGWKTVRTISLQGPRRLTLAAAKTVAAAATLLAFVAALLAVVLGLGLLIAARAGLDASPPPATELVAGLGIAWLVLLLPCLAGMAVASAFRSAAAGIGGSLLWLFLLEATLFELGLGGPQWVHNLSPMTYATAASTLYGVPGLAAGATLYQPIEPLEGLAVTGACVAVLAVLATWLPTRGEVTA